MSDDKKEEEEIPCTILGKEIGTHTSWDQVDDWSILLYNFKTNELGARFLKQEVNYQELCVNFDTGEVTLFSRLDDLNSKGTDVEVDWSVFNAL